MSRWSNDQKTRAPPKQVSKNKPCLCRSRSCETPRRPLPGCQSTRPGSRGLWGPPGARCPSCRDSTSWRIIDPDDDAKLFLKWLLYNLMLGGQCQKTTWKPSLCFLFVPILGEIRKNTALFVPLDSFVVFWKNLVFMQSSQTPGGEFCLYFSAKTLLFISRSLKFCVMWQIVWFFKRKTKTLTFVPEAGPSKFKATWTSRTYPWREHSLAFIILTDLTQRLMQS